jgi:ACS family pantothenate transporter-like MFS transporter
MIDKTDRRIPMVLLAAVLQLIVATLLLVPNLPIAATFFAFYLAGTSYIVNPIVYGWASVICQRDGDDAKRSVVLYAMSTAQAVLYTFWGVSVLAGVSVLFVGSTGAVGWVSSASYFLPFLSQK